MSFCSQCGKPVNGRFCANCGFPYGVESTSVNLNESEPTKALPAQSSELKHIDTAISTTPDSVQRAVKILRASLWLGAFGMLIGIPVAAHRVGEDIEPSRFILFVICIAIGWFIIGRIARGRAFARQYLVVVCALSVLVVAGILRNLYFQDLDSGSLLIGVLVGFGNAALELVALILLYKKQSSDWFKEMEVVSPKS